jgi:hypothetical protein
MRSYRGVFPKGDPFLGGLAQSSRQRDMRDLEQPCGLTHRSPLCEHGSSRSDLLPPKRARTAEALSTLTCT